MYNCLIIDDEPIAIRVIKKHLQAFPDFNIIAECNNAPEAIPIISKEKIDLIFCDIQMPQITGVEFIRSLTQSPKVIFTTAYREYAVDAFDLHVVDYLLKPISFERFARAIHNFLETETQHQNLKSSGDLPEQKQRDFIFLKADKKHLKINLNDILYFESLGDYVIVYTENKKVVTKERIGSLPENLPQNQFIQIHRQYIVSISKIESVGPGFVEVNKKKIPVGRSFKEKLTELLQNN
jgi:DNA-binding LytR/AlgR family response regulator